MAVHYKLKSSRKFESVFFEGHEITGRELKAEIAAKQNLGADAVAELTLSNPKTGEEYDDARGIPRNSSVLVTRKPPVRFPALQAASTAAAAAKDAADSAAASSSAAPPAAAEEGDEFGEAYSEQPQAAVLPDEDIAQALASQQQSWQAGLAAGGRGSRGGRGGRGGPGGRGAFPAPPQRPDDRPCPRCGQTGHWQQDCPTRDNPEFDVKRVHLPRGIPTSHLQASVAGEGSMVLPDGKIGTLRANEAAFLREMQASRAAVASRATPPVLPAASAAAPATAAALPAAAANADAGPLLLTEKPHDGASAAPAPASSAPPTASAVAAVPQFAGAGDYLPETLPVTTVPTLNGGLPSLGGGLPGALGGVGLPGLFPPLMRPGLGAMPGLLPLGAQLVAGEKPLSFEEFNRLKALAAAKQRQAPASRSKARSRSRSPSRRRSPKAKDARRRDTGKRRDRSRSRSPGRSRSESKERRRKFSSGKDKDSSRTHRSSNSNSRHSKVEPPQADAVVDAVPKATGWDRPPAADAGNGLKRSRSGTSPSVPAQVPRQRPPIPVTREFAVPQPRRSQAAHQQPSRQDHGATHGRGHDRHQRDPSAPSHDRRRADSRDGVVSSPSSRSSRPSPDDRWEEYSVVVAAPKRATPDPSPAAAQPSRVTAGAGDRSPHMSAAQHDGHDERPSNEQRAAKATAATVTTAADETKNRPSGADSGMLPRASSSDVDDSRQRASEAPARSAAEGSANDRSGSERLVATEEPPRQAVIEMPDEMPDEKVQPIEVEAAGPSERDDAKREKKKKHKKHKDASKKHKHRGREDAEAPAAQQEDAAPMNVAAAKDPPPSAEPQPPAAEPAPGKARIILKQNPPVVGKQLAQQRAAAMREAVQEDEDALATGAQSRSAVAALAPGSSRQSSLWARAISGLAADAQPKRRPSIAQRLSRPEEESSEALPGAGVADDGVRSPRKRSRSDAAAADAEGQDQETVRSEKVKHKKHKHRRE